MQDIISGRTVILKLAFRLPASGNRIGIGNGLGHGLGRGFGGGSD